MPHTHSLWLVPEGDVQVSLASTIRELAERHGGPDFSPHVTLLSGLVGAEDEILGLASQLAREIEIQRIEFEGLGAEDVYFRSLYLVARSTPELTNANQRARRLFGIDPPEPFRPHLSLIYGSYAADTKRAIADALTTRLPTACEAPILEVWRTDPPVERWQLTGRLRLAARHL